MDKIYFEPTIEFTCKAKGREVMFDNELKTLSTDWFTFRETNIREGLKKIDWDSISELKISNPQVSIKLDYSNEDRKFDNYKRMNELNAEIDKLKLENNNL